MHTSGRHWTLALGTAVLVHAGIAVALLWQPPESGARRAGVGGIEVSLGPAGGAPGGAAQPEATQTETTKVQPEAAPQVEQQQAPEPIEPPPEPVARVESAPEPEPEPEVEKAEPAEPEPEVAVKDRVEPEPAPQPEQSEPGEPEPQPAPQPAITSPGESPPQAEQQLARVDPNAPGAGGKSGTRDSREAGSADARSGGGVPGETADYMAMLKAWLERHKEYPRRAQLRRQQGTALLYFVMDRDGNVIDFKLKQSSGHTLLDREVTAMIKRAEPLPRIPEEIQQARLELVVPINFHLR